MEFQYSMM